MNVTTSDLTSLAARRISRIQSRIASGGLSRKELRFITQWLGRAGDRELPPDIQFSDLYRVQFDRSLPLEDLFNRLLADAGLLRVSSEFTFQNFPIKPNGPEASVLTTVRFPGVPSDVATHRALRFLNLLGLKPPGPEHALAFAKECRGSFTEREVVVLCPRHWNGHDANQVPLLQFGQRSVALDITNPDHQIPTTQEVLAIFDER